VGYSRLMRADEEGTYRHLRSCREIIDSVIREYQGRIFGSAGDSVVAEFASPVEALRAALEIQATLEKLAAVLEPAQQMHFRIGINLGDVLIEGEDLIGDGVNVAARLQGLADPGGICISGSVHEQIRNKLGLDCDDLGDQTLKNIADPVHAYRVPTGAPSGRSLGKPQGTRRWRAGAAGVFALLCLGAFAAYLEYGWRKGAPLQCGHASIAVLPFANLSGDPGQDYFSDGTTEDITAALGRFSDLSVIADVAAQQYRGKSIQPGELNRDLGVCYALKGSVRKDGDRVLITAQLIDAVTGRLLWSDSYDGEVKDVFSVRNQITQSVAGKLALKLQDMERQRALKKPTGSLDAYEYALRGRLYLAQDSRAANNQARQMFERAIELDPAYASAYAALGMTRLKSAVSGWTEFPDEALEQAKRLAQKAIDLDADNAEAHRVLGGVYFNEVQFDLALSEDNRAIDLNPNDAGSYAARGAVLTFTGYPKEAIDSFDIARRLNPSLGAGRLEPVGWAYYLDKRYEDAIMVLKGGLGASPDDYFIYAGLAAAYAQLDRKTEAASAAADVRRVWPFFAVGTFARQFENETDRALVIDGLQKAGLE
jgi:TolB-like protein/Flp pilus assembly protein TadD